MLEKMDFAETGEGRSAILRKALELAGAVKGNGQAVMRQRHRQEFAGNRFRGVLTRRCRHIFDKETPRSSEVPSTKTVDGYHTTSNVRANELPYFEWLIYYTFSWTGLGIPACRARSAGLLLFAVWDHGLLDSESINDIFPYPHVN